MSEVARQRLAETLARARQVAVQRLVGAGPTYDPIITDITFDSRRVTPGALFCCVRGDHSDGHQFAAAAVNDGAVAIVVDHELSVPADTVQIVVDDTRRAMAFLSAAYFGEPSNDMTVVGITGTNGKTTTAHILSCALENLGSPTGTIGTLSGSHTTPEAPELQRRLAEFKANGCASVAMEVSSHALALDRVLGTRFRVAVFTNLGRDHLDLHGTLERYFAAKARLFEPDLSDRGVINVDDVHGRLLLDVASIPLTTFSLNDASDIEIGAFHHAYTWHGERVRVQLGGRFNVMNSLAAATTLDVLGYTAADIASGLAATTLVPGRFEPVDAGQDFVVVVDYAHTPDALTEVLAGARSAANENRVIVVFGCGGDRDREKRPLMGLAAATSADQLIVTSDNPRSEDPAEIINDIIQGVPADYRTRAVVEPDRQRAIAAALRAAGPGDVVVIAGKGHETTQTIHSTVSPFDDRIVARTLLETMS
jgi:UDP-N-acetylmuramoyl-L-alanyl-D-glutamate--2,6-diaminopimelate ligase